MKKIKQKHKKKKQKKRMKMEKQKKRKKIQKKKKKKLQKKNQKEEDQQNFNQLLLMIQKKEFELFMRGSRNLILKNIHLKMKHFMQ